MFTIADAKRADIGNTSKRYAKTEQFEFDSVTISPYMGKDSVEPFLEYEGKYGILLALTSNEGSSDFQSLYIEGKPLYEHVIENSKSWKNSDRLMYVVGATKSTSLIKIRASIPDSFLLIPGVGVQGGSLKDVAENGLNKDCGILVNSSRAIIYASSKSDFDQVAAGVARDFQRNGCLHRKKYLMLHHNIYKNKNESSRWITFVHGAG